MNKKRNRDIKQAY